MSLDELLECEVSGVEFEYFLICKTQFWLFSHNIIKSSEDENVKIGRIQHDHRYKREKRERALNRSKFDVVKFGNEYVIYERKKSKVLEPHVWQLKYYLYQLKRCTNSEVKGILTAPRFRKLVILSTSDEEFIKETLFEIRELKKQLVPPVPTKKTICRKCAYREFCFGEEYE